MTRRMTRLVGSWLVLAACIGLPSITAAKGPSSTRPATQPVQPKELSEHVHKGLQWLVDRQLPNGGWGQGEESSHMRAGGQEALDQANVADTASAVLALLRSGSTPGGGPHATNIRRGIEFICEQVERSDDKSLFVTELRGTRLQGKLGTYVDTFMAAAVLAEVRNAMPDEASAKRVMTALDKTMDKIEKNQRPDGQWANEGWAPALTQGIATKALNQAAQQGAQVDEATRKRAEEYAKSNISRSSGVVGADGAAGIELYARSSNLSSLKASADYSFQREAEIQRQLAAPATAPAQAEKLREELEGIADTREVLAQANAAVVARMGDEQFVAGFGSNGGEEFLSYMNIGESLVAQGGADWEKWDKSMTENLNRIQNGDGSWSGHHCITGKTFCTSAALLVLMVDRTTVPLAEQMKKR